MHLYSSLYPSKKEISNDIEITEENIRLDYDSIYFLYKKEFPFYCDNILLKPRNDLLDILFDKISSIIDHYNKYQKKDHLYFIIKKCENNFISDEYIPMYNALSLTLSILSRNSNCKYKIKCSTLNKNLNYINSFIPHCLKQKTNNENAIHICGEKLIQVNKNIIQSKSNKEKNNINDNRKIKYIICPKCKKCYKNNLILMFCKHCNISYYSKLIDEKNSNNIYPATWEKYHCFNSENSNDINNYKFEEQMPCVKCNSKLWIKNNKLFCKNCKFEIDPNNLVWTCDKCDKEFRSNAKIYNKLNHKIIKRIIRDALIGQKIVKPFDLPCECIKKYKFDNVNFYHMKEGRCNGVLYYNSFNEKDYVICSVCKYISYLNDFNWFCPFCLRYFISNKIKIFAHKKENIQIYLRKCIFGSKPKINKYFSPNNKSIKNNKYNTINNGRSPRGKRVSFSQKIMDSKKYYIYQKDKKENEDKNNDSNINNKFESTLYTSYKKQNYKRRIMCNRKIFSCNNSIDKHLNSKICATKQKNSNLRIYISNKKIQDKFMTSRSKFNKHVAKFIFTNKKSIDNKNKNLMEELSENLKKDEIKLMKPKLKISSSIINISDNEYNDEEDKENKCFNNGNIIYNRAKRNNKNSVNKKGNSNNNCLSRSINSYNKIDDNEDNYNKTLYRFSRNNIKRKVMNIK